ncbi:uncharacterized protein LOC123566315 [Mercenaria mercenaria]|uniref:uncharacterized protein LOC123566315 n=1 Tax=Mercenaria mercenaria TaxID=6596 RepID=UPI00234FB480|nr:uncharacterized protein LOC123566315 [Mercenaria mercenaria]
MSAMYSRAFDHLQDTQNENDTDYTYQDPELDTNLSSFKRSGVGGRSTAFRAKERGITKDSPTHDDMGQDHSSQYIDVFDDARSSRRTPHQQTSVRQRESEPVLRRGHRNEDSEAYCYAYTQNVSRDEVTLRNTNLPTQRSVSLRDDYSQPQDRLSSSGSTQDYIEPYQSAGKRQNAPIVQPDPGGIYELAKDVTGLRESAPPDKRGTTSDHYNHLNDVTNRLNSANISDPKQLEERYDHVQSWSKRVMPLNSTDSGTEHYISAESSPQRKCSNVSDEVFTSNLAMNKTSPNVYQDLPANYEEPWDSEEGQKKFDRLMSRAERKHDSRKSFDQANNGTSNISVGQSGNKLNTDKVSVNKTGVSEVYEAAWAGKPSQRPNQPAPEQHRRPNIQANYEDAWDLPEKQREFEEKLLQARKQRTSQGQVREDETATTGDSGSQPFSGLSPTFRKTEPDRIMRSDSCRSLGALAEKIDKSLPLDEQSFYHGAVKRSAAERTLVVFKEGSYLVRRSETSKKDFSLTLKGWNGQPMHMKIACRPDGTYILGENSPPFKTIPEMVDYYTTHELPVQNADRICLLYPIPS